MFKIEWTNSGRYFSAWTDNPEKEIALLATYGLTAYQV